MIVFSRPPARKRRVGDPGSAGGFAEASVWTSTLRGGSAWPPYDSGRGSAAAPCLRETDASLSPRGPGDAPGITADQAPGLREPARPSDVSPSDESKYWRIA